MQTLCERIVSREEHRKSQAYLTATLLRLSLVDEICGSVSAAQARLVPPSGVRKFRENSQPYSLCLTDSSPEFAYSLSKCEIAAVVVSHYGYVLNIMLASISHGVFQVKLTCFS